ncbi:hypothetical protein [Lactococcus hircilactis]|nr:hypothetical protein [Lactococcus hircilactis]
MDLTEKDFEDNLPNNEQIIDAALMAGIIDSITVSNISSSKLT